MPQVIDAASIIAKFGEVVKFATSGPPTWTNGIYDAPTWTVNEVVAAVFPYKNTARLTIDNQGVNLSGCARSIL